LGGLTQEENEILKRLTDKQQKTAKPANKEEPEKSKENKQTTSEIYWQNIEALNPRF
jgi:predicted GTPase